MITHFKGSIILHLPNCLQDIKSFHAGTIFILINRIEVQFELFNNLTLRKKTSKNMKYMKCIIALSFFLTAISAQVNAQQANEESVKNIETIVGRWMLQKVYAGSREIATNPNASESWIEFKRDGTYERKAEVNDGGSYRMNENHGILYLESSQHTETSSATTVQSLNEFNISLKDDTLTMQSRGDDNSGTKYVYVKGGDAGN
jgi:hypothetical protein